MLVLTPVSQSDTSATEFETEPNDARAMRPTQTLDNTTSVGQDGKINLNLMSIGAKKLKSKDSPAYQNTTSKMLPKIINDRYKKREAAKAANQEFQDSEPGTLFRNSHSSLL